MQIKLSLKLFSICPYKEAAQRARRSSVEK